MLGTPVIIDRKPTRHQQFGDNPPEKVFVTASELNACPICNAAAHCWTLYNGRVVGCYNLPYSHSLGQWGKVGKNKKSGKRYWKYTIPVADAVPPDPTEPEPPPVYEVVDRYRSALTREMAVNYLKALNLPAFMEPYTAEIGLGWRPKVERRDGEDKPAIWIQPEFNADGDPIGYCGRTEYGKKDGDLGTKRGAFYLVDKWNDPKHAINRRLTEGPGGFINTTRRFSLSAEGHSCSATLAAMGILSFVSRFSVNGAKRILAKMFNRPENRDITPVLIGENDADPDRAHWPGWALLHHFAKDLATLIGRPVVIAMCPDGIKDVREWAISFAGAMDPVAGMSSTKWTTRDHTPESWAQLGRPFLDRLFAAGNLEFVHPGPPPAPIVRAEKACPHAYHALLPGKPGTPHDGDYAAIDSECGSMSCPACSVAKANSRAVWNHLCVTQVCDPASYPDGQTTFPRDPVNADELNVTGLSYGPWRSYSAVTNAAGVARILFNLRRRQSKTKRRTFNYLSIPIADTVFDSQDRWLVGPVIGQPPIGFQDLLALQNVTSPITGTPSLPAGEVRYLLTVALCPTQEPPAGLTRTDPVRLLAAVQDASREWADAYFLACPELAPDQDTADHREKRKRLLLTLPRQTSSADWIMPERHISSGNWGRASASVLPTADMREVADAASLLDRKGGVAGTQDSAVWSDGPAGAVVTPLVPLDYVENTDAERPPELQPRPATCSPAALLFEIGKAAHWRDSVRRPTRDIILARFTSLRRVLDGIPIGPAVRDEVFRLIPLTPDVCLDRVRLEDAAADDVRTAESRRLQREALKEYEGAVIDVPEGFCGGMFDPPKPAVPKPKRKRKKLRYRKDETWYRIKNTIGR